MDWCGWFRLPPVTVVYTGADGGTCCSIPLFNRSIMHIGYICDKHAIFTYSDDFIVISVIIIIY